MNPTNNLPLATLSDTDAPPAHRLHDAGEAQDLFWTLKDASRPRMAMATAIQGCLDGNPPYRSDKMRTQAQAWRSNFNSLEAASRKDSAKTPFYDLFSSASQYAECATREASDAVDASEATRQRSDHFDTLLRSYPAFDSHFNLMLDDFVAFNKGYLWFPKPDSWHFERLPWWRVLFPDGTSTNPDEWSCFAIEHRWEVGRLYRMAHARGDSGWNVGQVDRAIRTAAPDDTAARWENAMEMQRAFTASELWLSAKLPKVQAASIYVREFDGSWSRMMVEVNRQGDGTSSRPERPPRPMSKVERDSGRLGSADRYRRSNRDWLYFKPNVATNLWQVLCPFVFDEGAGNINEVGGLGKRIFSISQAKDRLINNTVDAALMRGGITLQAKTAAARVKTALVQLGGGINLLPEGYDVQQGAIFGDIEGSLVVGQDLDNRLDRNTGIYRPAFEKPKGNPESATAANIRYSQATVLTSSAVNRFYQQLDKFYDEVFRRVTLSDLPRSSKDDGIKAALAYQDACKDAGLSKAQCYDRQPGAIRAVRAIGNGSLMMRQQEASALAQLVPFLGPRGLEAWKVMFAAAHGGQTIVDRLLPREDTAQVPTRDDWDANQEDSDMAGGNQVVWAAWQNHQTHAQVHLVKANAAIQAVTQQGADPAGPFTYLQLALPHIAQHIQRVPREQIRKQLELAYGQVAQGARLVMQAAQKQLEQRGQKQQLTLEQQLEVQRVQHEIQMKEAKNSAQMSQRQQRQTFDMGLDAQRFQQDAALKGQQAALQDATTASGIHRDTAATAVDIELKRRRNDADIELARAKAAATRNGGDK